MPCNKALAADRKLTQIVDLALIEAARKSGEWLACRPGCSQCCTGVFAINQLDALRLKRGLAELRGSDPKRAARIQQRASESLRRLSPDFPGDVSTGLIAQGKSAERRFAQLGNDETCPVLDPATGLCDLYEHRPMTCRVFGPPVRSEDGLGVCELCFHGATDDQIAACEMVPDPQGMESVLVQKLENNGGVKGETIVAFCVGPQR